MSTNKTKWDTSSTNILEDLKKFKQHIEKYPKIILEPPIVLYPEVYKLFKKKGWIDKMADKKDQVQMTNKETYSLFGRRWHHNASVDNWNQGPDEPKWTRKLPPLGSALLKHLVDTYGERRVALAAQIYASKQEKQMILEEARNQIDAQLEVLKK